MGINVKELEFYQSRFLDASDLAKAQVPVKISRITTEAIRDPQDFKKLVRKILIFFEGKKKPMVVNKSNFKFLRSQFGEDTDAWIGQQLLVYSVPMEAFGRTVDALRLRMQSADGEEEVTEQ